MKLDAFKLPDWTKIWAGGWSLLTCSHFGDQYTKEIRFGERFFATRAIIAVRDGKSSCWVRQADRDTLGAYLSGEVAGDDGKVDEICESLKRESDAVIGFVADHENGEITGDIYRAFWAAVLKQYQYHINVKYIVDYLAPELLEKYLPKFEEARVYAEPVFHRTEDFMHALGKQIGAAKGVSPELALCLTKQEAYDYFETGAFPPEETLKERNHESAFLFDSESVQFTSGAGIAEVEALTAAVPASDTIKGKTAWGGKAEGVVRIIFDPAKADHFQQGDILVTGMTRPEYLSLMKKAAAFVTDAGGVLSHAAIVARELKKPCVIGTEIATKALKDGDRVEVDADAGTVRKLS